MRRHPIRSWSPVFALGVLAACAAIACTAAAARSSGRPTAAAVTAGIEHTCALTRTGAVKCWGYNGHDELGSGRSTFSFSSYPIDVQGLGGGVTSISAGARHSCAVTAVGGAKCWGVNYEGALGDGTTDRHAGPVDVSGLGSGVTAVAAGDDRSCALLTTGGVKCWGTSFDLTPTDVQGLSSGVAAIATGGLISCALMNTGGVKCWGFHYGSTPSDVPGLGDVKSLSTGNPLCGVTNAGGVKCWRGASDWLPVDVPGLGSGVAAVSMNVSHSCALLATGTVKCWGSNERGQLGDGTTIDRPTPVEVVGLNAGALSLSAGGVHTCAVTRTGGAKCWGTNGNGQLGDGTTDRRLRPVDVVGFGPLPAKCVVPRVVGKPLAKARTKIRLAHCRVGAVDRVASTKAKKVVVGQAPRPGKRLSAKARVNLKISRGR